MGDTIVYGEIYKEDLQLGYGTDANIVLPDGSSNTLTRIGIHTLLGNAILSPTSFSGTDLGAQINAAIAQLDPTYGGTIDLRGISGAQSITSAITVDRPLCFLWGPANYTFTAAPILTAGQSFQWIGYPSPAATTFTWNTSGYLLDVGATDATAQCVLRDFSVACGSSSSGFLRVGRTSQNFSDPGNFRIGWHLSNLSVVGPGATNAGLIGMSITQYLNWHWSNVTINAFETPALLDRGGNSSYVRCRFQGFRFGPKWTRQAGSGSIATGSCQDVAINPEFLGPVTSGSPGTGYGYTVEVDTQDVTFIGALYETQPATGKSQGLLHITASGVNFRDFHGFLSHNLSATLDNTFVFDNNYAGCSFFGTTCTVSGFPSISFGSPSSTSAGAKVDFVNCTGQLNNLVLAQPLGKYNVIGQNATAGAATNVDYRTSVEVDNHEGMIRVLGRSGYTQTVPSFGVGIETFYQDPSAGDQAITNVIDRSSSTFKPWLIQPSSLSVTPSGMKAALIANTSGIAVGIGVHAPATHVGMQHVRVSTGSIGGGAQTTVNVVWPVAFDDANYTVVCVVFEGTASDNLTVRKIDGWNASQVTVRINNNDGSNARTGQLLCIAMHD